MILPETPWLNIYTFGLSVVLPLHSEEEKHNQLSIYMKTLMKMYFLQWNGTREGTKWHLIRDQLFLWAMKDKDKNLNISRDSNLYFLNFSRLYKKMDWKCPHTPFSCDLLLSKGSPGEDRRYNRISRPKSSLLIRSAGGDFMEWVGWLYRERQACFKCTFLDNGSNECIV